MLVRARPCSNSRNRLPFINDGDEYLGSSVFIVCLARVFVNAWFINANRFLRTSVFIYVVLYCSVGLPSLKSIGEYQIGRTGVRNNSNATRRYKITRRRIA